MRGNPVDDSCVDVAHSQFLLAVVVLGIALGAAESATAFDRAQRVLAPPVIREGFTPLPCPADPRQRETTFGMEACAEHEIVKTDRKINASVAVIFRLLPDDQGRRRFAEGERAWLRYRRLDCVSAADFYRGGSQSPVAFAQCVAQRNRVYLKEVLAFQARLQRPH
jgi:uncharacterized protein YecT (DUF1311 family)